MAVAIAACTPDGGDGSSDTEAGAGSSTESTPVDPTQFFEALTVSEDLYAGSPQVLGIAAAGATDDLDAMVLARAYGPGPENAHLMAWSVSNGAASQVEMDLGLEGEVLTLAAGSSPELTAVVGTTWSEGLRRPFVATSLDRESWDQVALPPEADDMRLWQVAVVGETVYAAGGTPEGLVLLVVDAEGARLLSVADEGSWSAKGLAATQEGILVLAKGTETAAWLSGDGGETFTEQSGVAETSLEDASGAVFAEGQWTILGTRVEGSGNRRPLALTSPDGAVWVEDGRFTHRENREYTPWRSEGVSSAVVGAPGLLADGRAAVYVTASTSVHGCVYALADDGWWAESGACAGQPFNGGPGASSLLVPDRESSADVVRWSRGLFQVSALTGESWENRPPLNRVDPAYGLIDRVAEGTMPLLTTAIRSELRVELNGAWETRAAFRPVEVTPGAVTASEPAPLWTVGDGASALRVDVSDGEGDQWRWTAERMTDGSEWGPVQGDLDGLYGGFLRPTDGGWVLAASARPSFTLNDGRAELAILTSADGNAFDRWSPDQIGASSEAGSGANTICSAPGDTFLVTGEVDSALPEPIPALWRGDPAGVERLDVTAPGDVSSFGACALMGEATYIVGSVSGGQAVLALDADGGLTEVGELPDGVSIGSLNAADGLLAVGTVNTPAYDGPALLTSADGATWSWLPVPVSAYGYDGSLTLVDDGAYLLGGSDAGPEAWHIPDLAALVAAATPIP
ncbi:hypothetical protein [Serinibacter salmoneus]|uniref:hypothetical protein n=1 Tax=Serinibacter salmoneus TaxID=556530 RepID=UPI001179C413|nr:hypothetical protein [Serinibacter salmoneus]